MALGVSNCASALLANDHLLGHLPHVALRVDCSLRQLTKRTVLDAVVALENLEHFCEGLVVALGQVLGVAHAFNLAARHGQGGSQNAEEHRLALASLDLKQAALV